jgi:ribonuclease Z
MRQILALWSQIEGFSSGRAARARAGDRVKVGRDLEALALRTSHRVPSIGWLLERTTPPPAPEFVGREPKRARHAARRREVITDAAREPLLCVTGDTQIDFFDASTSSCAAARCSSTR